MKKRLQQEYLGLGGSADTVSAPSPSLLRAQNSDAPWPSTTWFLCCCKVCFPCHLALYDGALFEVLILIPSRVWRFCSWSFASIFGAPDAAVLLGSRFSHRPCPATTSCGLLGSSPSWRCSAGSLAPSERQGVCLPLLRHGAACFSCLYGGLQQRWFRIIGLHGGTCSLGRLGPRFCRSFWMASIRFAGVHHLGGRE